MLTVIAGGSIFWAIKSTENKIDTLDTKIDTKVDNILNIVEMNKKESDEFKAKIGSYIQVAVLLVVVLGSFKTIVESLDFVVTELPPKVSRYADDAKKARDAKELEAFRKMFKK